MKNYIKNASFISGDPAWGKRCPIFKKEFSASKKISSATLEITALGVYECFINGSRVGDRYMAPGWTIYPKRVLFDSYDVTDILKGKNVIKVGLGHGWFASKLGWKRSDDGIWGNIPAFACAMHIEYTDGSDEVIYSDTSWLAAKSQVLMSEIYHGENYDAKYVPKYTTNARIFNYKTKVVPSDGVPVRATERISVKEIITTPKGEVLLDFGQNVTGCLEFTVRSAKGGEVLRGVCGEVLDANGNFYNENYRLADPQFTYTAKAGEQTYMPHYTFYGFRYIKIISWCEEILPENFTAVVMHSDMKRTGYLKCGHKKLNKLYENTVWSNRDNFLDIPTDCPQRDERLGWTADAQVFCRTASINYDTKDFFTKWLRDVALEQKENGRIPNYIPDITLGADEFTSSAWGDAATIIPWELYVAYGDKKLLREHYPMMRAWLEYIHNDGESEYLWLGGNKFNDWLAMDAPAGSYRGSTDPFLISTAFYYYSATLVLKAARVLKKSAEEISYLENMREKVREAFIAEYVVDGNRLKTDTQTSYVLALHFGLCEGRPELYRSFADRLIELIEGFGDRLQTGFLGTPYLLDTLTEIGRADKAYTLLKQEKFPSWLFSVNMGATTIWEHWDGINENGEFWSTDMNSFNHYAYGSVCSWMYRTMCGIRPVEETPGYTHVVIAPIPDKEIGYATAKVECAYGEIKSAWKYDDNKVRYSISIPDGITATAKIADKTYELTAGDYTFWSEE